MSKKNYYLNYLTIFRDSLKNMSPLDSIFLLISIKLYKIDFLNINLEKWVSH